MNHDKIAKAVEAICKQGCTTVNEVIRALEHGGEVAETERLDRDERGEVLRELKSIMDVYEKKD